ncbi:cytochrome b5 domain-containing protein [Limosilactobacillus sp.]|uniref:cytochrome b5 domain-containing protein n=1 Tax=Limosilactobacillus sp. TaxID=2773925 RepID=UPI003F10BD7E
MTKEFTQAELKQYNGQNGQPAYVAIEGVVYDVSAKKAWLDGRHHGNVAGQDLTKVLANLAPHGAKVLEGLPVMGKLVQ